MLQHTITSGGALRRHRRQYLGLLVALLAASSLLVSAGVAAGSGTQKATLKISGVPASVKSGGVFKVTASGYSGNFDALDFFPLIVGACKSSLQAEALQQHQSSGVTKNHNFKDTQSINLARYSRGHTPGTYSFCVYLVPPPPSKASIHTSATYQVTP